MAGAAQTQDPGRPQLPRQGIPFGQPAGSRVTADIEVVSSTRLHALPPAPTPTPRMDGTAENPIPVEDLVVDDAAYRSTAPTPPVWGEVSPETHLWRFNTVGTVMLYPVRVSPATGDYEVAREMRVTVRFLDTPSRAAAGLLPLTQDAPGFESALDEVLINAESARRFRNRPRPRSFPLPVAQAQNLVRVRVSGTGPARINYAELAAAGFPAGTAVGQVRLEEHSFDAREASGVADRSIPRTVDDVNQNGVFDAGDHLLFYAAGFADRFHPRPQDARFTRFHAYWVHADTRGGADFPHRDGFPDGTYTPVTSFPSKVTQKKDLLYVNFAGEAAGTFEPALDNFYWTSPLRDGADLDVPFQIVDALTTAAARIRVCTESQGAFVGGETGTHHISLILNGTEILSDRIFNNTQHLAWCSDLLAGTLVHEGENHMVYKGRGGLLQGINTTPGAYWDGFDLTYDRLFKARNNELRFNTGDGTGDLEFAVTGFTTDQIEVWDVTDPAAPSVLDARVDAVGGGFRVRVRDTVDSPRTYLAFAPASVSGLPQAWDLSPDLADGGAIQAAGGRDLLAAGENSDYIIITHPRFRDSWQDLIDHREAQGHRVFLCDVWEVYDQFFGGDKDPDAILNFMKEAFARWDEPPVYLLLGGDANEDYRHDNPGSGTDWVPTMMHLASVPGALSVRELAGTDTYLVSGLEPGDRQLDVFPDMFVGRLPVDNESDIQNMVHKTIAYENMDPNDSWRNRGVFLADDQYSTGLTSTTLYCYQTQEELFSRTTKEMCENIHNLGMLPNFDCVEIHLADYLDTVDALGRCHDDGLVSENPRCQGAIDLCPRDGTHSLLLDTARYTREVVTPALIQELSRGELLWGYTGHANKVQITSETLFFNVGSTRDVPRINNVGRPFIFQGFACHLNEFEYWTEATSGVAIGEELLKASNRGAVASIASTGYEWLHTNASVQRACTGPLFWDVPRDPDTGRPRRILGEATTLGLVKLAMANGGSGAFSDLMRTYFILGDPALRVDVAPPQFQVSVEGVPVDEGFRLTSDSILDSVLVSARVGDDADLSAGGVHVRDGGTELPADRISLVPMSEGTGAQYYAATFKTTVRLGSYDVVIEAQDWFGRESRFVLPVRFETTHAAFFADSPGNPRNLEAGKSIDPGETVRTIVDSPVPLDPADFTVFLASDGEGEAPVGAQFNRTDEAGRAWTLDVSQDWVPGRHYTMRVEVNREGQSVASPFDFTVGERLTLDQAFFFPNPADDANAALHYRLSRAAEAADMTIYTVSGRRVVRKSAGIQTGENAVGWDLRDESGFDVANGVYLLVLTIEGKGGERIRRLEKVAVTR